MRTNLEAGSILLAGPKEEVCLVFERRDRPVRAVDPGVYRLRTTRMERVHDQSHWFISATGPAGEEFALRAGKATLISVDDSVHFKGRARRNGIQVQLGMTIQSSDGRGLSVYKNDRRVV